MQTMAHCAFAIECHRGLLAVSVVPEGSTATLQVFDIAGRTVLTSPAGAHTDFALAESGVYFVRLLTDTGASVTRTIAVIR